MVKHLCILGSTGSIGTQTLDIVRAYPDRYAVYAICAHRSVDKLVEQAREFRPEVVCIADESLYEDLKQKLAAVGFEGKTWAGADAIAWQLWWVTPVYDRRWKPSKPVRPSRWRTKRPSS